MGMCHRVKQTKDCAASCGGISCSSKSSYELCMSFSDAGNNVKSGFIGVIMGIAAGFLLIAGVLNIIGGAYCLKAKAAIQAIQANPASVPAAVAVPVAAVAVPVGPNKV